MPDQGTVVEALSTIRASMDYQAKTLEQMLAVLQALLDVTKQQKKV